MFLRPVNQSTMLKFPLNKISVVPYPSTLAQGNLRSDVKKFLLKNKMTKTHVTIKTIKLDTRTFHTWTNRRTHQP